MITIVETVVAVAEPLRLAGLIHTCNEYLYGPQVVVPSLNVCVYDFYMFVNALTIQESCLYGTMFKKYQVALLTPTIQQKQLRKE